ncbi:SCO family protein [Bacillus taeanensis]|uniref:SCO family protein n=1 Tax=Bacillus taeanensis TaxID=273032 RepID=A0A366Y1D4_9BACI|nr:SCO family protein [Bacillus taeanensis]RBW70809.1 SCO family protein [Bacillus taeanensis]
MGKRSVLLFLVISFIGFVIVYWFWPHNEKLPILDKVDAFQLEDVHGETYQLNNGKIKLITFFYTNCPDICPLTMMDFKELQSELKEEGLFGEKVELVAISFDPENDQQQTIKQYAKSFQTDLSGWKWLRGTPEETKQIAGGLQMQYQKLEGDFFSHSTTMYLLDQHNNIRAIYSMANANKPIEKKDILEDIFFLADHF